MLPYLYMKNASLVVAGLMSVTALITILFINNQTPSDASADPERLDAVSTTPAPAEAE
jgi:hypothetical protein